MNVCCEKKYFEIFICLHKIGLLEFRFQTKQAVALNLFGLLIDLIFNNLMRLSDLQKMIHLPCKSHLLNVRQLRIMNARAFQGGASVVLIIFIFKHHHHIIIIWNTWIGVANCHRNKNVCQNGYHKPRSMLKRCGKLSGRCLSESVCVRVCFRYIYKNLNCIYSFCCVEFKWNGQSWAISSNPNQAKPSQSKSSQAKPSQANDFDLNRS